MRPRGFTLLEVVVAVAILGMAATALFGLFSGSLFNLRKIEEVHRYQLAAEDVMQRVLSLSSLPADGRAEGTLDEIEGRWVAVISPYVPMTLEEKPSQAVMKIDVEMVFPGRTGERRIKIEAVKPTAVSYGDSDFERAIENAFPR
jgi:general secretion pathway protein I